MAKEVDVRALPSGVYLIGKISGTREYPAKGDRPAQMGIGIMTGDLELSRVYLNVEVARALELDNPPGDAVAVFSVRPYASVSQKGGASVGFGDCQFVGFL